MIKVIDLAKQPLYPKFCVYGPTGTGKTTLLGTMPGPGLILDIPQIEGGTFVLADKASRIKGVAIEEWGEIDEIYWALVKRDEKALPGVGRLRWVAVDSISAMLQLAKRKVVKERDRDLGADPHKITLPEWGAIGQLVGELIYRFCALPYAVLFTAQERSHGGRDNDPGPMQLGPDVIRSALLMLKPPMTLIGRLSLETEGDREQRILTIGPPDGLYIAKARMPPGKRLPYQIRNPHLGKILRYMFEDGPKPKAARSQEIL